MELETYGHVVFSFSCGVCVLLGLMHRLLGSAVGIATRWLSATAEEVGTNVMLRNCHVIYARAIR